jgi:hypothetical protein
MLVPEFWQMLGYTTDSDWFIQDTCVSFATEIPTGISPDAEWLQAGNNWPPGGSHPNPIGEARRRPC